MDVSDDAAPPTEPTAFDELADCLEHILSLLPTAYDLASAAQVNRACRAASAQGAIDAAQRLGWPLNQRAGESAASALRAIQMLAALAQPLAGGAAHSICIAGGKVTSCGSHPHYPGATAHLGQGEEVGPDVCEMADVALPDACVGVVRYVAAGGAHSALVTSSGDAYTWGAGGAGRLGLGVKANRAVKVNHAVPQRLSLGGPRVVQVACGSRHTLLLSEAGYVYASGANETGQLGVRVPGGKTYTPVYIASGARQVSACEDHSAALIVARGAPPQLFAWGHGRVGQLGNGDDHGRPVPTAVRFEEGQEPPKDGWAHVSMGPRHTLAVARGTGEVYVFGLVLVPRPPELTRVFEPHLTPTRVELPAGAKARTASAGGGHNVVLGTGGEVYTWGTNDDGQLGHSPHAERVVQPTRLSELRRSLVETVPAGEVDAPLEALAVAAGFSHTLIMVKDGHVLACGDNSHGQTGLGEMVDTVRELRRVPMPRGGAGGRDPR